MKQPTFWGKFWLVQWLFLNIFVTLLNKSLFSHFKFPFPIALTAVHMFFTALLSIPAYYIVHRHQEPQDSLFQNLFDFKFVTFSVLFCANILFSNLGLNLSSVAMVQVIRATNPVIVLIMSYLVLGDTNYTTMHVITVIGVVCGVAIATYGDLETSMWGFFLILFGCFLSSCKSITSSIMLGKLSIHPLDLSFKMSIHSLWQLLLIMFLGSEAKGLYAWYSKNLTEHVDMNIVLYALLVNGVTAFLLNFSNFMFTKHTSALTVTIAGNVKNTLTIVISIFIFSTPLTLLNAIGSVIAISGAIIYSFLSKSNVDLQKRGMLTQSQVSSMLIEEDEDSETV